MRVQLMRNVLGCANSIKSVMEIELFEKQGSLYYV